MFADNISSVFIAEMRESLEPTLINRREFIVWVRGIKQCLFVQIVAIR